MTEYAADLGYDVAMVRTPHFYKRADAAGELAGVLSLGGRPFATAGDHLQLPAATGYDMPAELVIELADHPNIIGIKESSGDVEKARKMVEGTRHVKRERDRDRDL